MPPYFRQALYGFNYLLLASLGYAMATLLTLLMSRGLSPLAQPMGSNGAAMVTLSAKKFTDYGAMLEDNVFHARRSSLPLVDSFPDQSSGGIGDPLPGAGVLPVTLAGVFKAGSSSVAFVMENGGTQQKPYKLGQCLPDAGNIPPEVCSPGQGKLVEVGRDRIVVNKDGRHYFIELARSAMPASSRDGAIGAVSANVPQGGTFEKEVRGNSVRMSVPTAEVEKSFGNFAEVMRQARAIPLIEGGVPKGFSLQEIEPGSIYQKLGLQDGDVITAVNGQPLTTADQAIRLFQVFRNERDIALDVTRGGQRMKLSYSIR